MAAQTMTNDKNQRYYKSRNKNLTAVHSERRDYLLMKTKLLTSNQYESEVSAGKETYNGAAA